MVSKKVKPTVRVASKKGLWAGSFFFKKVSPAESSTYNQAKPAARPVFQC